MHSKIAGKLLRKKSGDTTVTSQAPINEPRNAKAIPGSTIRQRISTRLLYCQAANAEPHTEAPLFVPNSVAGIVVGYTANNAGTKIKPPPPTTASTKPAISEASVTINKSIVILCRQKKSTSAASAF